MKKLSRLKYLIPSLITATSIYFACKAASVSDSLVAPSWYLLICVLLDKMDGTSARLLKATTKVGIKMDSLADSIAFGLLPGLIIFRTGAKVADSVSVIFELTGVIFIAATFLRLRKFNRLAAKGAAPNYFYGVPSTLAAAIFASFCVAFGDSLYANPQWLYSLVVLGLILSVLMNLTVPTMKVGVPKNRILLGLQSVGFIYIAFAIITKFQPVILFVISVFTLFLSFYGAKDIRKNLASS
jgi:CDP-diacylglycerol--serine O-phosphatidyltransferase